MMHIKLEDKIPGCHNFYWREVFETQYDSHKNFNEFLNLPEAKRFEVYMNIIAVANRLQGARDILGFPIPIDSWYRSPRVDEIVGGKGVHPTGGAIDPKLSGDRLKKFCNHFKYHNGGLGQGTEQAHMDILLLKPNEPKRRWFY